MERINEKPCIICEKWKPLSEYYTHPKMGDGHLNKCKECTKAQSTERQHRLFQDPEWREKERLRSIERYNRLNYRESQGGANKAKPWKNSLYKKLHKKLGLSKDKAVHHWNYNLIDDYFIMDKMDHRFIHRYLVFDEATLCFLDGNNDVLTTREAHFTYITELLKLKK